MSYKVESSGYTKEIKIIEVPKDYYECTVCGEYHPAESFYSEKKAKYLIEHFGYKVCTRTRTNCYKCYTHENMDEFGRCVVEWKNTKEYQDIYNKLFKQAVEINNTISLLDDKNKGMTVIELINQLKQLPPTAKIFMDVFSTYDSYSNDGEYYSSPFTIEDCSKWVSPNEITTFFKFTERQE